MPRNRTARRRRRRLAATRDAPRQSGPISAGQATEILHARGGRPAEGSGRRDAESDDDQSGVARDRIRAAARAAWQKAEAALEPEFGPEKSLPVGFPNDSAAIARNIQSGAEQRAQALRASDFRPPERVAIGESDDHRAAAVGAVDERKTQDRKDLLRHPETRQRPAERGPRNAADDGAAVGRNLRISRPSEDFVKGLRRGGSRVTERQKAADESQQGFRHRTLRGSISAGVTDTPHFGDSPTDVATLIGTL